MDDFDDGPAEPPHKRKTFKETVKTLQYDLSAKETECSFIKADLQSDIWKLKHKLKIVQSERAEDDKQLKEENQRNLEAAYKQYEKNVQFIRNRHQENIQALQTQHEEQLQTTIHKYEEQISNTRRQIQELPQLRLSLQSKEEEIHILQEEVKNNKRNYDDKVSKLIQDLENEKVEEEAEKWDLKKYVEIFKKRCLVLETMLENQQRVNNDLKEKVKDTNKNCEIRIAKAKIDYEARERSMEDQLKEVRKELETVCQQGMREQSKAQQKMENDLVTYESKILMLSGQIDDQKRYREILEIKNADLEDKIGIFRDAVSKIKDQYEATLTEIKIENDLKNKKHKAEIDHLVHQIEEVKLRSELEINQQKLQANAKIEELAKILKEQKWSTTGTNATHQEAQTDPCELEADKIRQFAEHLEAIKEKFTNEKVEYQNTISRLTSQMDEQKECFVKIIELKQQLEVTSINLESSSESNKKYFKEFIKLKKDFDTAKKHYEIQLRKHHQEIQKYQNLNKDLTAKCEKLKKDYEYQVKTCTSVQKHHQELEEATEDMKTKFGQTTKAIDAHMDVLKNSINDNKAFYVETVLQLKEQLEAQMKQIVLLEENAEKVTDAAETKLKEYFEEMEMERDRLIEELEKQNQMIGHLTEDLEIQTKEVMKIKIDHVNDISKLRHHYEKEMKHTDDLILLLTNDLEHNNRKYNKLKHLKAKTITQTRSQISEMQKNYEEKIKALESQLEGSANLLETTNGNLKKEISQLLMNKELLEKTKTHVEMENERYLLKIESLTKYCEDLKSDIESLQMKSTTEHSELRGTIELNKKEYDEYIKKLKEDIKRGKAYIEQLIKIKENLELKLRKYEKKVSTLQKYVKDTFIKYNAQLAQELSFDDVATFERQEVQLGNE